MKVWPTVERIARLTAAYWNGEDDGALDDVREYYHQEFMGWPLDVSRPQNGEQYINWLKSMRSFIRRHCPLRRRIVG